MDTRFWGPSGWKLLHLITFDYEYSPESARKYADFFETLPFILPCKFCRASLTDYYKELPYKASNGAIPKDFDTRRWMYDIHNKVNNKLRKQGLNPAKDPSYPAVKEFYEKWHKCGWEQQLATMWDFLFAVAYNHPKESTKHSTPMPDCPKEIYKCKDNCEKNKWNILPYRERIVWFKRFWCYLPVVLPSEIRTRWQDIESKAPPTLECRRSTLAWLWRMRCGLDSKFKDPYTYICKHIATYSSDCGKKRDAYTCRRKKHHNKTVKKSR